MGSHSFGPVEHRADLVNTGLAALRARGLDVSALNSAQFALAGVPSPAFSVVRTPDRGTKTKPRFDRWAKGHRFRTLLGRERPRMVNTGPMSRWLVATPSESADPWWGAARRWKPVACSAE